MINNIFDKEITKSFAYATLARHIPFLILFLDMCC